MMKMRKKYKIKNAKVFIVFFALVILLAIIVWVKIYNHMNTYDGLGEEGEYPKMSYKSEGFYRDKYNFLNYKFGNVSAKRGIDVSSHQGYIDWKKVKNSGVEFAIIRLGFSSYIDGSIHMDEYFQRNIEEAHKNGIEVGVYFFSQATNTDDAIREAKYVLDNIKSQHISIPIGFDMEPVTEEDRIKSLTVKQKTEIADAFCQIIRKHRMDVSIYGNPTWISNNIDLKLLCDYEIWLAHYTDLSDFKYDYKIWQYTSEGIIDGIDTHVDLNIMFIK